jgi:hypothetical protein
LSLARASPGARGRKAYAQYNAFERWTSDDLIVRPRRLHPHTPVNHNPDNHNPDNHKPNNHQSENHNPDNYTSDNHTQDNHSYHILLLQLSTAVAAPLIALAALLTPERATYKSRTPFVPNQVHLGSVTLLTRHSHAE